MKYKIAPLNIFSIYLICLCVYIFIKTGTQGWDGLFALVLIFAIIFCIGIDILFQSRIKNSWKVWTFETVLVAISAWLLGLP